MSFHNPVNVTEDEVVFEVNSAEEITRENILEQFSNNKKKWIVLRPLDHSLDFLDQVRPKLFNDFFVQVGFICESKDLNLLGKDTQSLNVVENFNFDVFLDLAKKTFATDFYEPWKEYLGKIRDDFSFNLIEPLIDREKTLSIFKNEKLVAMTFVFKHHDCLKHDVNQIGWVWVDGNADKKTRDECHLHLTHWYKNKFHGTYQAGIHIENIRSRNFFYKMGFRPKCLHIALK